MRTLREFFPTLPDEGFQYIRLLLKKRDTDGTEFWEIPATKEQTVAQAIEVYSAQNPDIPPYDVTVDKIGFKICKEGLFRNVKVVIQ
jgi:hypothetical protein